MTTGTDLMNSRRQFPGNWFRVNPPKVGEIISGLGQSRPSSNGRYFYKVTEVETKERFGKPQLLLTVDVLASSPPNQPRLVEANVQRWVTQLL